MAVQVTYASTVSVRETMDVGVPAIADNANAVNHTGFNTSKALNAATTPTAAKAVNFDKAMTAGAATIDLTSLTGVNNGTVSLSGLKVHILKVRAPADNAAPLTVGKGASNGYSLSGTTAWSVPLEPGAEVTLYGAGEAPDVGGSAKTIDLAGTGTDAVEVHVTAGLAAPPP